MNSIAGYRSGSPPAGWLHRGLKRSKEKSIFKNIIENE